MGRDIPMAEDRESKTAGDLSENSELEPLASESEILALPSTADQASVVTNQLECCNFSEIENGSNAGWVSYSPCRRPGHQLT